MHLADTFIQRNLHCIPRYTVLHSYSDSDSFRFILYCPHWRKFVFTACTQSAINM